MDSFLRNVRHDVALLHLPLHGRVFADVQEEVETDVKEPVLFPRRRVVPPKGELVGRAVLVQRLEPVLRAFHLQVDDAHRHVPELVLDHDVMKRAVVGQREEHRDDVRRQVDALPTVLPQRPRDGEYRVRVRQDVLQRLHPLRQRRDVQRRLDLDLYVVLVQLLEVLVQALRGRANARHVDARRRRRKRRRRVGGFANDALVLAPAQRREVRLHRRSRRGGGRRERGARGAGGGAGRPHGALAASRRIRRRRRRRRRRGAASLSRFSPRSADAAAELAPPERVQQLLHERNLAVVNQLALLHDLGRERREVDARVQRAHLDSLHRARLLRYDRHPVRRAHRPLELVVDEQRELGRVREDDGTGTDLRARERRRERGLGDDTGDQRSRRRSSGRRAGVVG
eukprot:31361-Pelagococcus_subviridis.AAC.3